MPIRRLEDTFTGTSGTIGVDELSSSALDSIRSPLEHVKPHIQPGTLYPAVAGKLLDGTTSHSGAYGTAQSDDRSYYYTDIKGSGPIKDPRIGAHFGSQRHKCTSLQKLEQETASHGKNVYSIDGREWMRIHGIVDRPLEHYDDAGTYINCGNGGNVRSVELEITGYFNKANIAGLTNSYAGRKWESCWVNGTEVTTDTTFVTSVTTPLSGRYVATGSLIPIEMGTVTSPQLTTIRLVHDPDGESTLYLIELIAQDTTSTATKSKIQIPAQNVVSYGKKIALSAAAHHYNPFAQNQAGTDVDIDDTTSHGKVATGWAGTGAGYFDDTLDTATSLGLSAWETGGDFYRPVNGGRVVKWIDSSGNIKTSVNMIPPSGQAVNVSSDAALPTSHAWTTVHKPKFSSTALDFKHSEVAKTFNVREFGNGAANQGQGGTMADVSMLTTNDNIAYVMDDGLTSITGHDCAAEGNPSYMGIGNSNNDSAYITFIGTGITYTGGHSADPGPFHIAMNLPYGTHILKITRDTDASDTGKIVIDGYEIWDQPSGRFGMRYPSDFSFYQPKMPPIPENAVVIADYMLMADYVKQTDAEASEISKGVRLVSASRDFKVDVSGGSLNSNVAIYSTVGHLAYYGFSSPNSPNTATATLPFFGNSVNTKGETGSQTVTLDGTGATETSLDSSLNNDYDIITLNNAIGSADHLTVGQHTAVSTVATGGYRFWGMDVVSPVHTSFHYQTFETPYLHELVGGDRNMEQTNLVVTEDGKTWDEVTRDTSYMSSTVLALDRDAGEVDYDTVVIFDECRGHATNYNYINHHNKDFALAYDRQICLRDGAYLVNYGTIVEQSGAQQHCYLKVNGVETGNIYKAGGDHAQGSVSVALHLKRGDYLQIFGGHWSNNTSYSFYNIQRINK